QLVVRREDSIGDCLDLLHRRVANGRGCGYLSTFHKIEHLTLLLWRQRFYLADDISRAHHSQFRRGPAGCQWRILRLKIFINSSATSPKTPRPSPTPPPQSTHLSCALARCFRDQVQSTARPRCPPGTPHRKTTAHP